MNKDKMVVITFCIARFMEDLENNPSVDLKYGPCTEEEGKALCEIINTKWKNSPWKLFRKLPGNFTSHLRSYLRDAWSCQARVIPAFSYHASVSRVIGLLDR